MLVINYNENKPITDYFKYSVQGNNNADVVVFTLSSKQSTIDLLQGHFNVYVKCESDDGFVDKVDITDSVEIDTEELQIECSWTLLKKHTINRQLLIGLSFEDVENEIIFQTQLIKLNIANGIDVDEEIANEYPTILQQLEARIKALEDKEDNNANN